MIPTNEQPSTYYCGAKFDTLPSLDSLPKLPARWRTTSTSKSESKSTPTSPIPTPTTPISKTNPQAANGRATAPVFKSCSLPCTVVYRAPEADLARNFFQRQTPKSYNYTQVGYGSGQKERNGGGKRQQYQKEKTMNLGTTQPASTIPKATSTPKVTTAPVVTPQKPAITGQQLMSLLQLNSPSPQKSAVSPSRCTTEADEFQAAQLAEYRESSLHLKSLLLKVGI